MTARNFQPVSARPALGALLLGAALVLCAGRANAQVNIERLRDSDGEPGWSGALGTNLNLQRGNSEVLLFDANAAVLYHVDVHDFLVSSKGSVGESKGDPAANVFGHLRWTAMWWGCVGTELFTQLEYDEFLRMNLRALVGAGPRLVLMDQEAIGLRVGTAYMLEHEKLDLPPTDSHPRSTLVHRSSSYLSLSVALQSYLQLVNTTYLQPRFDRPRDLRLLEDLSLEVSITSQLKLTLTLGVRLDTEPPDEVEELDLQLKNGLLLKL